MVSWTVIDLFMMNTYLDAQKIGRKNASEAQFPLKKISGFVTESIAGHKTLTIGDTSHQPRKILYVFGKLHIVRDIINFDNAGLVYF